MGNQVNRNFTYIRFLMIIELKISEFNQNRLERSGLDNVMCEHRNARVIDYP